MSKDTRRSYDPPFPYIIFRNSIAVDINSQFTALLDFSRGQLLGKSINEISDILRASSRLNTIEIPTECYIFSSSLAAINIIITIQSGFKSDEKIYCFYEIPNSRLENKFPVINQLCSDNIVGIAVFKMPEIILLKANQTWLDFLDKPFNKKENSIGRYIGDIITGWTGSSAEGIWNNVTVTEKPYYNSEFSYDKFERGITYWNVSISPVSENEALKYAIEISREVTEQVRQRQTLEEQAAIIDQQNKQLELIVENISDGVIALDKKGRFILQNRAARAMFPQSLMNKLGDSFTTGEFFDWQGNKLALDKMPAYRLLRGEKQVNEKIRMNSMDTTKYLNINGVSVTDDNDNLSMALVCCRDITEQVLYDERLKAHQEDLLLAEKKERENLEEVLRLKDEFLYIISHEFKTPLNVINSAVQTLEYLHKDKLPEKVNDLIGHIKQNSFRQLRLVNNLLDIIKLNAGEKMLQKKNADIVLLTQAIVEAVKFFAGFKEISISFTTKLEQLIISIDDEIYERILLNILSNAIKFTPVGKSIFISLSKRKIQNRSLIFLEVEDQGIGIPEEKQDMIFERFGQVDSTLSRQAEGTGIGLHLVKLLVDGLGGEVLLESELGKGSTFTVILPLEIDEEYSMYEIDSFKSNHLIRAAEIEMSDIYL